MGSQADRQGGWVQSQHGAAIPASWRICGLPEPGASREVGGPGKLACGSVSAAPRQRGCGSAGSAPGDGDQGEPADRGASGAAPAPGGTGAEAGDGAL